MLDSINIKNFVLIDELNINFKNGFTILTGETGAGKSILLDAIDLALGGKYDENFIKQGCEEALVIISFDLNKLPSSHKVFQIMQENCIDLTENNLIFKRLLSRGNKGKCFLNDNPTSLNLIKIIGGSILEIHGQFENIFNSSTQKKLLDNFCNFEENVELEKVFLSWQDNKKKLIEQQKIIENFQTNKLFYKEQLEILEEIKPEPFEEEKLLKALEKINNQAKVKEISQEALDHLNKSFDIVHHLSQAQKILQKSQMEDFFKDCQITLDQALINIQETVFNLEAYTKSYQNAFLDKENILERLQKLRVVARKYMVSVDELGKLFDQAKLFAEDFDSLYKKLEEIENLIHNLEKQYIILAEKKHCLRIEVAKKIESLINKELPLLHLSNAKVKIDVTKQDYKDWTKDGFDKIDFLASLNPQQPFLPISKVASGGEMARLMIAIKVVLLQKGDITTIIFDEVDSNVGGQVALGIGKKLKDLSLNVQVMAITHSPQVACYADHHMVVEKNISGNKALTTLKVLKHEERFTEIARMLGGENFTSKSIEVAKELLQKAKK